jgi:hypothetical protein
MRETVDWYRAYFAESSRAMAPTTAHEESRT